MSEHLVVSCPSFLGLDDMNQKRSTLDWIDHVDDCSPLILIKHYILI